MNRIGCWVGGGLSLLAVLLGEMRGDEPKGAAEASISEVLIDAELAVRRQNAELEKTLQAATNVKSSDASLKAVVASLVEMHKTRIRVDSPSLNENGVATLQP